VLATREDLLAGALTLIGGQGGSSVESDGRFAQAVKAAGAPGDLRLVADLETLVKEPHFRSYWVQENITELKQYSAAVSDLTRTPRKSVKSACRLEWRKSLWPATPPGLATWSGSCQKRPASSRLMAPPAEQASTLIFGKVSEQRLSTTRSHGTASGFGRGRCAWRRRLRVAHQRRSARAAFDDVSGQWARATGRQRGIDGDAPR
jgi:hypothetical protein